jgi:hypothetical protein
MSALTEGSEPLVHRRAVIAVAVSIAVGTALYEIDKSTCGAIMPWVDVGVRATPLLFALTVGQGLIVRKRIHFMIFMLLYAGMTLCHLLMRPTEAAWFVVTGLLWSAGVVACAKGNRRAGAACLLVIGCLVTGLQFSRMPWRGFSGALEGPATTSTRGR